MKILNILFLLDSGVLNKLVLQWYQPSLPRWRKRVAHHLEHCDLESATVQGLHMMPEDVHTSCCTLDLFGFEDPDYFLFQLITRYPQETLRVLHTAPSLCE